MQTIFPQADPKSNEGPWYTHRWPWLVMAGPAAVVVAASFSGWLAFARQDEMVSDDYYNRGLAINQDIRRDVVATNLALVFAGRYDPATEKFQGTLSSFGQPVTGSLQIHLTHATDPKKDRTVLAQLDQRGNFSVSLPILERTRWGVVVENQQHYWRLAGTWHWPEKSSVDLHADPAPAK